MNYYLIAGERSGDLHGANLIRSLIDRDPEAQFRCWGGDYMREAGAELIVHYNDTAFMGFIEVLKNLGTIRQFLEQCKQDILCNRPDVLILIDYPGFNLRIAEFAHKQGIPVHYYISPKIWAWNTGRAKKIKAYVDELYCILPFEKDFYKQFDYEINYVGNPLFDEIRRHEPREKFLACHNLTDEPIIALLPGSRKQEIERLLDVMMELVPKLPHCQFVLAAIGNMPSSFYKKAINHKQIKIVYDQTYDLLSHARAAVVTSGTATLETALFNVPQVVCYKTSWLTYQLAKLVIKVKYISLVNLIADRKVVTELIQGDCIADTIVSELSPLVEQSPAREQMLVDYAEIKELLGHYETSDKVAELIIQSQKSKRPSDTK